VGVDSERRPDGSTARTSSRTFRQAGDVVLRALGSGPRAPRRRDNRAVGPREQRGAFHASALQGCAPESLRSDRSQGT